jgi:uncharacterized phiE125 gp8 family phage protein
MNRWNHDSTPRVPDEYPVTDALLSAPADQPVTLDEAKAHCRVLHTRDDAYISRLIKVATEHAEDVTQRALESQVWVAVYRRFPCGTLNALVIPRAPLIAVQSVEYLDVDENIQTVDSSIYRIIADAGNNPARLVLRHNKDWPGVHHSDDAVRVTFMAGYGRVSSSPMEPLTPEGIRHAILMFVVELYENRADTVLGLNVNKIKTLDMLLRKNRIDIV